MGPLIGKYLLKALPYLMVIALIGYGAYKLYDAGVSHGSNEVQDKWDEAKKAERKEIKRLKDIIADKEEEFREENTRITHELSEAQREYEVAIANQRSEYERRLQNSTERARVYQRQAESGAAECRSLASHAAELDQSLEEGRYLVRELRDTLRLRENQLRRLGEQIMNDRTLLSDETVGGTNGQ
jgi:transketolase